MIFASHSAFVKGPGFKSLYVHLCFCHFNRFIDASVFLKTIGMAFKLIALIFIHVIAFTRAGFAGRSGSGWSSFPASHIFHGYLHQRAYAAWGGLCEGYDRHSILKLTSLFPGTRRQPNKRNSRCSPSLVSWSTWM